MVWTEKEKIMLVSGSQDKKSRKRERVRGDGAEGGREGERGSTSSEYFLVYSTAPLFTVAGGCAHMKHRGPLMHQWWGRSREVRGGHASRGQMFFFFPSPLSLYCKHWSSSFICFHFLQRRRLGENWTVLEGAAGDGPPGLMMTHMYRQLTR